MAILEKVRANFDAAEDTLPGSDRYNDSALIRFCMGVTAFCESQRGDQKLDEKVAAVMKTAKIFDQCLRLLPGDKSPDNGRDIALSVQAEYNLLVADLHIRSFVNSQIQRSLQDLEHVQAAISEEVARLEKEREKPTPEEQSPPPGDEAKRRELEKKIKAEKAAIRAKATAAAFRTREPVLQNARNLLTTTIGVNRHFGLLVGEYRIGDVDATLQLTPEGFSVLRNELAKASLTLGTVNFSARVVKIKLQIEDVRSFLKNQRSRAIEDLKNIAPPQRDTQISEAIGRSKSSLEKTPPSYADALESLRSARKRVKRLRFEAETRWWGKLKNFSAKTDEWAKVVLELEKAYGRIAQLGGLDAGIDGIDIAIGFVDWDLAQKTGPAFKERLELVSKPLSPAAEGGTASEEPFRRGPLGRSRRVLLRMQDLVARRVEPGLGS